MVAQYHLKLKNIEIGYTFDFSRRNIPLSGLRIYANANNVFTFRNALSDYGIDPETTDGSAYIYPLTKVLTVGLNFRF